MPWLICVGFLCVLSCCDLFVCCIAEKEIKENKEGKGLILALSHENLFITQIRPCNIQQYFTAVKLSIFG